MPCISSHMKNTQPPPPPPSHMKNTQPPPPHLITHEKYTAPHPTPHLITHKNLQSPPPITHEKYPPPPPNSRHFIRHYTTTTTNTVKTRSKRAHIPLEQSNQLLKNCLHILLLELGPCAGPTVLSHSLSERSAWLLQANRPHSSSQNSQETFSEHHPSISRLAMTQPLFFLSLFKVQYS